MAQRFKIKTNQRLLEFMYKFAHNVDVDFAFNWQIKRTIECTFYFQLARSSDQGDKQSQVCDHCGKLENS